MRLKLTLEYDGAGFRGWAAQPGLRTVEGVLRDALATVFPSVSGLAVAGRTDTGVHALGNVVEPSTSRAGPAPERAANALERRVARRRRGRRSGGGRSRLRCSPLGPFAELPLPHLATA